MIRFLMKIIKGMRCPLLISPHMLMRRIEGVANWLHLARNIGIRLTAIIAHRQTFLRPTRLTLQVQVI